MLLSYVQRNTVGTLLTIIILYFTFCNLFGSAGGAAVGPIRVPCFVVAVVVGERGGPGGEWKKKMNAGMED